MDSVYYLAIGFLIILAVMIFYQSHRRKSVQAEYQGMLDTLRQGMRVRTVGGVIGKIIEIREDASGFRTVLLETGTDGKPSFVLYDIQAIYGIVDDEKIADLSAAAQIPPDNEPQDVQQHNTTDDRVEGSQNPGKTKKTKSKNN
jgi:preprotein translocase subunit YajC